MAYRSLLVHVEIESASSEARLQLAAGLAKRQGATLIGVAAAAVRPIPMGDAYGGAFANGEIIEDEQREIAAILESARVMFASHPSCADVLTEWRSAVDLPADMIARESRSADLVIVGRERDRVRLGPYHSADPGDVLMRSGRPVLVVPPGTDRLDARRITIAWKDTREARRAVADALPLLIAAEEVLVVEIAGEADIDAVRARVGDIVAHLSRHEVNARAEIRPRREGSVTDELILAAEQQDADLIVAGGYGHARLREWIFGGVTNDLLDHSPKCCLLSH